MTSRLLALPREIRDNIYTRLYQEITFKDKYQLSDNHILVKVRGVPLPQLFMVNRQLRNEYKEALNCSAHIAIDTLEPFRFHHLEPQLQHFLAEQAQRITFVIDFRAKRGTQRKRFRLCPQTIWRMLQALAHEAVCPQLTSLKIAYLDFMDEDIDPEVRGTTDRDRMETAILAMRIQREGRLFLAPPPRKLEGLRLVQSADAYGMELCNDRPGNFVGPTIRPVRVGLLAYASPGCRLNEQSFWLMDEKGHLSPLAMEEFGCWVKGKYHAGVQPDQGLKGFVDRKKVEAIMSAATYPFICESPDCHKCVVTEEDPGLKEPEHKPPFTCCGPLGPMLPDAPRDLEPGWQEVYGWPAAAQWHRRL